MSGQVPLGQSPRCERLGRLWSSLPSLSSFLPTRTSCRCQLRVRGRRTLYKPGSKVATEFASGTTCCQGKNCSFEIREFCLCQTNKCNSSPFSEKSEPFSCGFVSRDVSNIFLLPPLHLSALLLLPRSHLRILHLMQLLNFLDASLCVLFAKITIFVKQERVKVLCIGSPVLPNLSLIISKVKAVI